MVGGFIGGGGGATNYHGSPFGLGTFFANELSADFSVIGGGVQNTIQTFADYSTIGGGKGNEIANDVTYAVIPGGYDNFCGADYKTSSLLCRGFPIRRCDRARTACRTGSRRYSRLEICAT